MSHSFFTFLSVPQRSRQWLVTALLGFWILLLSQTGSAQFDAATFGGQSGDDFLPVEEAYKLLAERNSEGGVDLLWSIAEGYYLYGHAFAATTHSAGAERELDMQMSPGKPKHDEYFGDVEVYYHSALVSITPPEGAQQFSIRSQGCADAGLCYPPRTQYFSFDANGAPLEQAAATSFSQGTPPASNSSSASAEPAADQSFVLMALFAFAGGLILNLMPCVFPVLALKVLGLVNANDLSQAQQRMHGLSYTAGVVVCFLAVAGLLIALRAAGEALGWGFQLQTPWLVAALVYLFFVLAMAMAGYFELGASFAGSGQQLTEKGGHAGSFFTGVLAVLVASPCTAPFMGAALGFALVQPAQIALLIFAALGLGMAAPFLLLVSVPALARILPRPGPWMATFKEVMAIPLFLTAIWLLWVVGQQTGVNGMAAVLCGCLVLYLALWLWQAGAVVKRIAALLACLVAAGVLASSALKTQPLAVDQASSYAPEKVLQLREQGKPVFVNLTAAWCITCLANERVALSQASVLDAFRQHNVAYLKGDWTNSDPVITELLAQYGRSGVPLYLLFPADSSRAAIVLPQVLTPEIVIDSLKQL